MAKRALVNSPAQNQVARGAVTECSIPRSWVRVCAPVETLLSRTRRRRRMSNAKGLLPLKISPGMG